MSKYTVEVIAAIRAAAPLDLAKCQELAETPQFKEADISAKGIIAKARTMNVEYIPVQRVSKTGEAPIRKTEIVADIEAILQTEGLASLAKASKQDLQKLKAAIS